MSLHPSLTKSIGAGAMGWNVRSVYYYLVCFATLLMLVFGGVQVVNHALNLLMPREAYGPSAFEMVERMRHRPPVPGTATEQAAWADTLDEATLERMAEDERRRMNRMQRREDLRGLLRSLTLVLIAAPLYAYHWRRVRGDEIPPVA